VAQPTLWPWLWLGCGCGGGTLGYYSWVPQTLGMQALSPPKSKVMGGTLGYYSRKRSGCRHATPQSLRYGAARCAITAGFAKRSGCRHSPPRGYGRKGSYDGP